ncbi:MAG: hypothetical protein C4524_09615 [Candidatus Zixiibacteriota bacterium]|nr:MAG: hypothetical protein C4524_09615 [candidate division Zixibacteria bacterium]
MLPLSHTIRRPGRYLLPLLLLALALRLAFLGQKPFWSDEGVGWWMALGEVTRDAPRIYPWAFGWAPGLLGWHEAAGRLPSVLAGVLLVAVIYALGKALSGPRTGLYAAALATVSAYLVPMSQEMRLYSLLGLEIAVALWAFLRMEEGKGGWGAWLVLLAAGVAGQYTHCFFLAVLGYLGAAGFLKAGWRNWRAWGKYALLLAAVALAALPEMQLSAGVAQARPHLLASDLAHLGTNAGRVVRSYFAFHFGSYLTNLPGGLKAYLGSHPLYLAGAAAMALTGMVAIFCTLWTAASLAGGRSFRAWAVRLLLGMLVLFTLIFLAVDVSTAAHLVFVYVPFLLLTALFLSVSQGRYGKAGLGLLALLSVVSLAAHYRSPQFPHERADWRAAGRLLQSQWQPGDALFMLRARDAWYTLKFYYPDLTEEALYQPRHDSVSAGAAERSARWAQYQRTRRFDDLLRDHPRVWVLESDAGWDPPGPAQSWDFGPNLQVHRLERSDSRVLSAAETAP